MAYLDHVRRCNAHDLSRFRPWHIGEQVVGWFRLDFLERLRATPGPFEISDQRIALADRLVDPTERTEAIANVCLALVADGLLEAPRGEMFPVAPRWGIEPFAEVDRKWVTHFGLPAYGVHMNGYVQADDGLYVWIARRAKGKMTYPGELDNLVAGGQPTGLGLHQNMMKEAAEEADIPPDLAVQIQPAGAISYVMEHQDGIKFDTMFCFDLALPPDFTPNNTDGEVDSFMLLPIAEAAAIVRDTYEFKFNCNLVMIDFLIRHGQLNPDDEPDYSALCAGLQTAFPFGS